MIATESELVRQIDELPDGDKLELVEHILSRLDRPDPQLDQMWGAECQRRWAAYKAGKIKAVPFSEIMAGYGITP